MIFEVTPKFSDQITQPLLNRGIQGFPRWKSTFFKKMG